MIDYDRLLASIPEGLDQIEIARYLYIELGRFFIYDPEVIFTRDNDVRKKIAYRGIDEITDNKVVCISLSQIYTELLKRCGINAETVYIPADPNIPNDIGHAITKITIEGKKGSLELVRDLTNIKVGLKTNYFLHKRTKEELDDAEARGLLKNREGLLMLDDETLRQIDEKIGYTHNRQIFERCNC